MPSARGARSRPARHRRGRAGHPSGADHLAAARLRRGGLPGGDPRRRRGQPARVRRDAGILRDRARAPGAAACAGCARCTACTCRDAGSGDRGEGRTRRDRAAGARPGRSAAGGLSGAARTRSRAVHGWHRRRVPAAVRKLPRRGRCRRRPRQRGHGSAADRLHRCRARAAAQRVRTAAGDRAGAGRHHDDQLCAPARGTALGAVVLHRPVRVPGGGCRARPGLVARARGRPCRGAGPGRGGAGAARRTGRPGTAPGG